MDIDPLYCVDTDIGLIKEDKQNFIEVLLHKNIRYSVLMHINAAMNTAIKEIEEFNKNKIQQASSPDSA